MLPKPRQEKSQSFEAHKRYERIDSVTLDSPPRVKTKRTKTEPTLGKEKEKNGVIAYVGVAGPSGLDSQGKPTKPTLSKGNEKNGRNAYVGVARPSG